MLPLALALLAAPQAEAGSLDVQNYGLAGIHRDGLRESSAVFEVYEALAGSDLNADGDLIDFIVHTVDLTTGTVSNLGVYATAVALSPGDGSTVALAVWETGSGQLDLNGDGDSRDDVLFLRDVQSGGITLTALALGQTGGAPFRWEGDDLLLLAREQVELGDDFNSDGDSLDRVLGVRDGATGVVTFSGLGTEAVLSAGSLGTAGDWVVFAVDENMQGEDLDGDGTTTGAVAHAWSRVTGAAVNLGFTPEDVQGLGALDVALRDASPPHALHVFDGVTGTAQVVRTETTSLLPLQVVGRRILFLDGETAEDLNGDGDVEATDHVLRVEEPASGASFVLPFASADFSAEGPYAAFLLDEAAQQQDANGDGDQLDTVLHTVDLTDLSVRNLGLDVPELSGKPFGPAALDRTTYLQQGLLPFRCAESELGQDVNSDGDLDDLALCAWDFVSQRLRRSGVVVSASATPALSVDEGLVFAARSEADDQSDHNGDGDQLDSVLALWHVCNNTVFETGLAVAPAGPGDVSRRSFLFDVSESDQGGLDLDGNGLTTDFVTHRVALLAAIGTTRTFGAGTAGSGGIVPRLVSLGCPEPGGLEGFYVDRGRGGSPAALVAGVTPQSIPLVGGTLFVFPFDLALSFTLGGSIANATGDAVVIPGPIDVALAGRTYYFQGAVIDSAATGNVALTNALQVDLGAR